MLKYSLKDSKRKNEIIKELKNGNEKSSGNEEATEKDRKDETRSLKESWRNSAEKIVKDIEARKNPKFVDRIKDTGPTYSLRREEGLSFAWDQHRRRGTS